MAGCRSLVAATRLILLCVYSLSLLTITAPLHGPPPRVPPRLLVVFRPPSRNMYGFSHAPEPAPDWSDHQRHCSYDYYDLPRLELSLAIQRARAGASHLPFSLEEGEEEPSFHPAASSSLFQYQYLKVPPLWLDDGDLDVVAQVAASRCVLVFGLYEVYGEGPDRQSALQALSKASGAGGYRRGAGAIGGVTRTRRMSSAEINEALSDLKDALSPHHSLDVGRGHQWHIIEDDNATTGEVRWVWCGLRLARGLAAGGQDVLPTTPRRPRAGLLARLTLRNLPCCAPTSMEPEIALVMASLAGVGNGARVIDPFCGSGSLLVAARVMGASEVVGVDVVDYAEALERNLAAVEDLEGYPTGARARSSSSSSSSSFTCGDMRDLSLPPLRQKNYYTALITDPPYGIVETAKGIQDGAKAGTNEEGGAVSEKVSAVSPLFRSLLQLAEQALAPGGTCVFFHPYWLTTDHDHDAETIDALQGHQADDSYHNHHHHLKFSSGPQGVTIPIPPSLSVVARRHQRFSPRFHRTLIVLRKRTEPP